MRVFDRETNEARVLKKARKFAAGLLSSAFGVSFIPSGGIAATNVQDALQELDSEKLPKASPVFTGELSGPTAKIGGASDNFEVEADGSWKANGAGTTYEDIDFPIVIRTTGAGIPALATFQGNLTMAQWQVNDYNVCEVGEMKHPWKEGSTAYWHVHVWMNGSDTTNRYLNFEIEFTGADVNSQIPANTIVSSGDFLLPANTPAPYHHVIPIYAWTPAGMHIAAHVKPRLKRIASSGTAPTSNPFCEMMQLHIECDRNGSRQQWIK